MLIQDIVVQVITYYSKGRLIFLNDWEYPSYFLAVFLTLFSFGDNKHLKNRQQPISIEAWAK